MGFVSLRKPPARRRGVARPDAGLIGAPESISTALAKLAPAVVYGFRARAARPGMTEQAVDFAPLPIDAAVPKLTTALRGRNAGVLVAPPGAGKTTRVPLVLAGEEWARDRRILVLEPRRLAARAAAARMAQTLSER